MTIKRGRIYEKGINEGKIIYFIFLTLNYTKITIFNVIIITYQVTKK